jgi:hypothetical protein
MIVRAILRAAGSTIALVAIYYLLPLDHSSKGVAVTILVTGLVALIALVAFQVRSIIVSPFPGLRAIEALATSLRCSCCCSPAPTWLWTRFPPAASRSR